MGRLPVTVKPSHYDISLVPDLEKFTFSGKIGVKLDVSESVNQIALNSAAITVKSASVLVDGHQSPFQAQFKLDESKEELYLDFSETIPAGKAQLFIDFDGLIGESMRGFYRAKYQSGEQTKFMTVTQFEAVDARRAFPCWDEPSFKATFSLTLEVPSELTALSNMPVAQEHKKEGTKVVTFEATPVMSTYLLCWAIGELEYIEGTTQDGRPVRVYTRAGKKDQGHFALDVTIKTLAYFNEYFDIAYPLPKMDLIAVPEFAAGAMENWGLITFREVALLVDPHDSSASTKQNVCVIVTHELAHQWFGNLVTMEWWEGLWLNEGFASWVSYLATDFLYPEWDMWTQFLVDMKCRALQLDALASSHPIEVPIGDAKEVDEIFDAISYNKGGSAINQIFNFLGKEAFREGLRIYLKRHSYGNTRTEDLWQAWGEASGQPVPSIMDCWTKQIGYPMVSVVEECPGCLKMKQTRFLADGSVSNDPQKWLIPLSIVTSVEEKPMSVLMQEETLTQTLEANYSWVKINKNQTGFFRTHYHPDLLLRLADPIRRCELPASDRLGTQNDGFALARAMVLDIADVLAFVRDAYTNETNLAVWEDLSLNIAGVESVLTNEPELYGQFMKLVRELYTPVFQHVGWDPKPQENAQTTMLRSIVLGRLAGTGHAEVIEEGRRRFSEFEKDAKHPSLPSDIRGAVYKMVLASGKDADFDRVVKVYTQSDSQEERNRVLAVLGTVKCNSLMQRTLDMAIDRDLVNMQDAPYVLRGVASNPQGGQAMTWNFVRQNWTSLEQRYAKGFLMSAIVSISSAGFASEDRAQEVEGFFKQHDIASIKRTVSQSVERIRSNAKWLNAIRAGKLPDLLKRL